MNTPQPPSPQSYFQPMDDEGIDFKRYLSLFISNWYWFAVALFISMSIAYGINRWSEEVYTVSSTLLIKDDPSGALTNIFRGSDAFSNQQNVNNEIGILKSYNLNYRVMKELPDFWVVYTSVGKRGIAEQRSYKSTPFVVVYDSLSSQTMGQRIDIRIISDSGYRLSINGSRGFDKELSFGERFREQGFDFVIRLRNSSTFRYDPDASNRYYFRFVSPVSLANQYRSKLSVTPIKEEASLVTLSTTGYEPNQEIDYLNTLMRVYLEFGLEYKNQTAAQTIRFIEDQLGTISDSLRRAESNLENFRLSHRLIDISREGVLVQQKLEQIDAERTRLLMQKNYYEYLRNYVVSKNESADIIAPSVMGVTDQLLMRLVDELSSLLKQKRQLSLNLYESAEPLRVIDTGITNAYKALEENIENGLRNIESSVSDADRRLLEIEKDIRRLPSTERQMINIQRKFDINNTVYTFLLEKRAEAGIARASNVPDNRIIDDAGFFSTAMVGPKKRQNLMMALVLGLFLPALGIVLVDYLNNKIIDKKDLERRTSIPVIGYISHNSLKSEIPVAENPGSTLSESFRSVRTSLKYFLKDRTCPVISVSSTITGEGKTFVSINLAAIIAMSGKRVLLAGLDLRKPRIHRIFGAENEKGISSYLIGEEKYEDIVLKTEFKNLFYTPAGPVPPNPAELIDSEAMAGFIARAREEFDFIILDTPPVAIVTDALLLSPFSDFYLFVVRQRYTSRNTLALIEELRAGGNLKSIGIVMNDISMSGYYGYGLRYGYSMGYGYNYGYNYYSQYGKYGYSDSVKGYYSDET
ncbi:MAG TPA: polysaccharide biosynthesis tyrosine autokinase [Bacteroidales bacterium]|nr:polysaccharide biosynthesis tyrosine autokinase [Bacteroidales bacterium]HNR40759.1 polysaccharide biosynthesis tyrosine autokinase [Bacteroidales bacterium]